MTYAVLSRRSIVWVSQEDWPGVEDVIELGRAVDVVVTAVRDPALYRYPLELQCVDPDLTGLLPNTRTPTDAPLVFPLDTTEADLERIAVRIRARALSFECLGASSSRPRAADTPGNHGARVPQPVALRATQAGVAAVQVPRFAVPREASPSHGRHLHQA